MEYFGVSNRHFDHFMLISFRSYNGILTRLGGQASFDPRMTSVKSLCKLQGKTWEQVIRWCVEEGHQIYRLRRGTTFRFSVLPASCSLPR